MISSGIFCIFEQDLNGRAVADRVVRRVIFAGFALLSSQYCTSHHASWYLQLFSFWHCSRLLIVMMKRK